MDCRIAVVASLLAAGLSIPGWAADPVVATPWEVRREAEEVLAQLAQTGDPKAERSAAATGALLERAQRLLEANGRDLVARSGVAAPVAELVAAELKKAGLAEQFAATFTGAANRRLADALGSGGSDQALGQLVASYPSTTAAATAARLLADRAWDRGRLGSYLELANLAGDERDAARSARFAASAGLIQAAAVATLPTDLDGLEPMWSLDLGGEAPPTPKEPGEPAPRYPRLAVLSSEGEAAVADGRRLLVIDPLVGQVLGQPIAVGDVYTAPAQAAPVAIGNGYAASGIDQRTRSAVVAAVDRIGRPLWDKPWTSGPAEDAGVVVSAPVALGRLVVVAENRQVDSGAVDLVVTGIDAGTGRTVWRTVAGRMTRGQFFFFGNGMAVAPAVAVQAGTVVVLSNTGCLARIAADGVVRRMWSYSVERDAQFDPRAPARVTTLGGDGRVVVATPADAPGLTLALLPGDASPRVWRGDGSGDEVIAVADGQALLAGRAVTLLDVNGPTPKPRWSLARRCIEPAGAIGTDRVLVAGREGIQLLRRSDGSAAGAMRGVGEPYHLSVGGGVVTVGQRTRVHGLGASAELLARLQGEVAVHPEDHRRLASLAALHEARGNRSEAVGMWQRALAAGADPAVAERAARSIRRSLDLSLDDPIATAAGLASLKSLAVYDPGLAVEALWWEGRRAETINDRDAAADAWRRCLTGPTRPVPVRDRIEVDLHLLAQSGLHRLGLGPMPLAAKSNATGGTGVPAAVAPAGWSSKSRRGGRVVVADGLAVGFSDGALTAVRLSDGSEAWWRRGQRAMLGVQWTPEPVPAGGNLPAQRAGVPVRILRGTSAARAGMLDGDRILSFNGAPVENFSRDLVPQVLAMPARAPFTIEVERGGVAVTLTGNLGTDLVEPITAAGGILVARSLMPQERRQDNQLFVMDLVTGQELWSGYAPPADANKADDTPAAILIGEGRWVVATDGDDLAAWNARPGSEGKPKELWRLPGQATALKGAVQIGPALWLPGEDPQPGRLVDVASGRVLALVPGFSGATASLDGLRLFLASGRTLASLDLGLGRVAWQTQGAALLAVQGDAVVALDADRRVAVLDRSSGAVRRLLPLEPGASAITSPDPQAKAAVAVVVRSEGRTTIAQIDPGSGTVVAETRLPTATEEVLRQAHPDGVALLLRHGDGGGALLDLGRDGAVRALHQLTNDPANAGLLVLPGAYLLMTPTGLEYLPIKPPPAAGPMLPALSVDAIPVDASVLAEDARLTWQTVGTCRYAVALGRNELLIAAEVPAGATLSLRLGDAGPQFDDGTSQPIEIQGGDTSPEILGGGEAQPPDWRWTVARRLRLPAAGDRPARAVAVLRAAPDRLPALLRVLLRAEARRSPEAPAVVDGPAAPWWWRPAWRQVQGKP
ncbi:hypothetical protein LBMAG53_06930 [Planctomycetota bacterium]|nr:hypothetical protein LBMAG53_06930 [Planctomycetota bacterium]